MDNRFYHRESEEPSGMKRLQFYNGVPKARQSCRNHGRRCNDGPPNCAACQILGPNCNYIPNPRRDEAEKTNSHIVRPRDLEGISGYLLDHVGETEHHRLQELLVMPRSRAHISSDSLEDLDRGIQESDQLPPFISSNIPPKYQISCIQD